MTNAKLLARMFILCVTAILGHSQDFKSKYVAPVHPVPRGQAPGMKVQLLEGGAGNKEYAVIFAQGDEAFQDCRSSPRNTKYKVLILRP